jgi:uncharacterized protein YqjF (DUF2071 family)
MMTQTWHDLLFAHWPIDSQHLRSNVPSAFELDTHDGQAWIGIVSFHMSNVGPRGMPSLPWVSAFPELNVRTYVRVADRPGVYFFSLDAGNSVAVYAARTLLNLPYYCATMTVTPRANGVDYHSRRAHNAPVAEFTATYGPTGPPFVASEGSLEYFLTERYCLYHLDHRGAPYRLEIHHPPWALQRAHAMFARNTMTDVNGIALPDRVPWLHFVKRQDIVAWAPTSLPS